MITITQRKKLKKVFKHGYYQEINNLLQQKKITNKNGKEYSKAYISHVLNGRNSNDQIEETFFELYQIMRDKQSKKKIIRKKILENKKTEVAASV